MKGLGVLCCFVAFGGFFALATLMGIVRRFTGGGVRTYGHHGHKPYFGGGGGHYKPKGKGWAGGGGGGWKKASYGGGAKKWSGGGKKYGGGAKSKW